MSPDVAVNRPPGRPRDEQATRAITDAALRQLAEHGYAGVSMESIAIEANVARTTVYRRFRDKADLITAAIAANAGVRSGHRRCDDPRTELIAYLEEFDESFGEHCIEVIGTLLGSRAEREALALHRHRVVAPRMAYARGLLAQARERGRLPSHVDVDVAVEMLVGSVFARRVSGVPSSPGWARRAVDMIWPTSPARPPEGPHT
jgi:AcrR family transcriptional regulator